VTSTFPAAPDNIRTDVVNGTAEQDTHPALHNQLADAINTVETTLLGGGTYLTIGQPDDSYYIDGTPPAIFLRQHHRLFVGDAASISGVSNPVAAGQRTWVGNADNGNMTYFETTSQTASFNTRGGIGVAAAARTSDMLPGAAGATIGVGAYVRNDNTNASAKKGAWAFYGHAAQIEANSFTTTVETDVCSYQPLVDVNPYSAGVAGTTAGVWVGVGGETAQGSVTAGQGTLLKRVSVGLAFTNTAAAAAENRFNKGIVFQNVALYGTDGSGTGTAVAIEMARGHAVQWLYDGSGNPGFQLRSDNNQAYTQTRLVASNGSFAIRTLKNDLATETPLYTFLMPNQSAANTENNSLVFGVSTNATGTPGTGSVTIQSAGYDTNVNIALTPKGTGQVIAPVLNSPLISPTSNTVEVRNGANIQTVQIYKTYTDGTNYERLSLASFGTIFYIQSEAGAPGVIRALEIGTGGAANLRFRTNGTAKWEVSSVGHLIASTNNGYDIGVAGNLPRNIYLAGSVAVKTKAGTPVDADYTGPADGMLAVDTTANKIWARVGGVWKGVVIA